MDKRSGDVKGIHESDARFERSARLQDLAGHLKKPVYFGLGQGRKQREGYGALKGLSCVGILDVGHVQTPVQRPEDGTTSGRTG